MLCAMSGVDFGAHIRDIPDWSEPGIIFEDTTPLQADPVVFGATIDALVKPFLDRGVRSKLNGAGVHDGAP